MKTFFLSVAAVATIMMAACGSAQKADSADVEATDDVAADEITLVDEGVVELAAGDTVAIEPEQLTIIDFNAEWCGPCNQFKPVFHQAAKDYAGKARFISVNVDSCPDVAAKYNVSSIPQITFIAPNGEVNSIIGYRTQEDFAAEVNKALGAD